MADYLARPATSPEEAPKYEITDSGNSSMKVVVRVRPESEAELRSSYHCVVKVLDEHVLVFDPAASTAASSYSTGSDGEAKKPFGFSSPGMSRFFGGKRLRPLLSKKHKDLRFAFDRVFDETSSQIQVFHHTTSDIVDGVLDGINCSVFAYGATGAGKTYTMLGHAEEEPGIIFLTMMELYRRIETLRNTKTCKVSVSYCEVYNETIHDLLVPSGPLHLREDSNKGLVVSGLTCHTPKTAEEILQMLKQGNGNRTQHPTEANATSSRSHAVFQVFVEQHPRTAGLSAEVIQAKMSLIDLAGSERATVTSNRGARLREGANINRSLLALGNCINALAADKGKSGYVPYRDSKLTRLLKDSLGGNCRTVMVANLSPSALSYEDTYNTLKYADRAKQIKTALIRNVLHVDYHMTKYKAIIQELRKEISELKVKVNAASPKEQTFDPMEANRLRDMIGDVYGERGRLRKHMADLDAKEREALLKVCRKERDLSRMELLSTNEVKKSKLRTRLSALRKHVMDVQRQKQTVNEYLFSNNESVGRIQGEINTACRAELGGSSLRQLLESVIETHKLEVENGHQWKQTKHLLKYIKNQERELTKTEKILGLSLSLIRRQHIVIKSSNISTETLQEDIDTLVHLSSGDKGVAWADQTRLSTNDLQDINTSMFSRTQQELFDCFLEHSSPRLRRGGGGFIGRHSPQLSPPNHIGILMTTQSKEEEEEEGEESDGTVTPTLSRHALSPHTSTSNTVTVRASHIISSPHKNAESSQSSSGSVTVTTDVCISSDIGSDSEDLSQASSNASSSGLGSYTNSELSHDDVMEYDRLVKKDANSSANLAELTRRPAFNLTAQPHPSKATPTLQTVFSRRPIGTPFSARTSDVSALRNQHPHPPNHAPKLTHPSLPGPTPLSHPPQPYSLFQPFQAPPPGSVPYSGSTTPTSLLSNKSISTDSGIGNVTSISRSRGSILIPNRPHANGFMVRSNPSPSLPSLSSSSLYYQKLTPRFNAFEDNFVTPPPSHVTNTMKCPNHVTSTMKTPSHVTTTMKTPSHVTSTMKTPIGAFKSPLPVPRHVPAPLNPYAKTPAYLPRPHCVTGNNRSPHVYQSINVPPTNETTVTLLSRSNLSHTHQHTNNRPPQELTPPTHRLLSLSKSTAISKSEPEGGVADTSSHTLNSTFTVHVDVSKGSQRSSNVAAPPTTSNGSTHKSLTSVDTKKTVSGRGVFSRGRAPSKLPSYLRMTKSSESKKISRAQNKENPGHDPPKTTTGQAPPTSGQRLKKFNLNRSRDRINNASGGAPVALATRYNSAPQLAW